jgi:predicted transcriptional regulator
LGLTDEETMVYQTFDESGEAVLKDLMSSTKLKRAELKRALDRLVALGFVGTATRKCEIIYREMRKKQ